MFSFYFRHMPVPVVCLMPGELVLEEESWILAVESLTLTVTGSQEILPALAMPVEAKVKPA
jgi:hypothetical protein